MEKNSEIKDNLWEKIGLWEEKTLKSLISDSFLECFAQIVGD